MVVSIFTNSSATNELLCHRHICWVELWCILDTLATDWSPLLQYRIEATPLQVWTCGIVEPTALINVSLPLLQRTKVRCYNIKPRLRLYRPGCAPAWGTLKTTHYYGRDCGLPTSPERRTGFDALIIKERKWSWKPDLTISPLVFYQKLHLNRRYKARP